MSWQLPTWTESAALVGALCRLGAVQNPMLPIYRYREVSFIAQQTGCKLLITPSTWNKFDYGALAEQVAGEVDGMHALVADHWNPDGDPATLPPRRPAPIDRPTIRCAGSSTRRARPRSRRARAHTDRSVLAGAIGYAKKTHVVEVRHRARRVPVHARGRHHHRRLHAVAHRLGRGADGGVDAAGLHRADPEARGHARERRARDPRRAARRSAREPDAYKTIRAFPSGGSAKPPQLHDDLMDAVPTSVGITSGYGMTEAPIVSQTDIDAPDSSKRAGEGTATPASSSRCSTTASSS